MSWRIGLPGFGNVGFGAGSRTFSKKACKSGIVGFNISYDISDRFRRRSSAYTFELFYRLFRMSKPVQ